VADVDETDLALPLAAGFHDAVDAVARQAEDGINAPIDEMLDE
jgi:hypothetical protein